jgi:small-conductance mechanosensitive channel
MPPQLFQYKLFELGGRSFTVATLFVVAGILVGSWLLTRLLRGIFRRALHRGGVASDGQVKSLEKLLNYVMMLVGTVAALQTAGVDLSAVLAASAVFAVGIGLGLQGVAMNFVCGIVLLVERSVKIDDVLEIDGKMCRVMEFGIRATRVRTPFEEDIIMPNGELVQKAITNLTLHDPLLRITVKVGVAYSSDLAQVRSTLDRITKSLSWTEEGKDAVILLTDFGPSSVDYDVSVWVRDPWRRGSYRSQLREAIWEGFRKDGIVIAFPQLDVHLDAPGGLIKAA